MDQDSTTKRREAFDQLLASRELPLLKARRKNSGHENPILANPKNFDFTNNLTGVGLSGGGIRSAAFNTGIIQALAKRRIFPKIDVISSVSGGGYVGSMVSARAATAPPDKAYFPQNPRAEEIDPLLLEQLHSKSSYLAPTAATRGKELFLGFATALRGFIIHIFLGLLLFGVFILPFIVWDTRVSQAVYALAQPKVAALAACGMVVMLVAVQSLESAFRLKAWIRNGLYRAASLFLIPAGLYFVIQLYRGLAAGLSDLSLAAEVAGVAGNAVAFYVTNGPPGKPRSLGRIRRMILCVLGALMLFSLILGFHWFYKHGLFLALVAGNVSLPTAADVCGQAARYTLLSSLLLYAIHESTRPKTSDVLPRALIVCSSWLLTLSVAAIIAIIPEWYERYVPAAILVVLIAVVAETTGTNFRNGFVAITAVGVLGLLGIMGSLNYEVWKIAKWDTVAMKGIYSQLYSLLLSLAVTFCLFMNLNRTSLHGYYRDHLAALFIGPNAEEQSVAVSAIRAKVEQGLPYHVIQCAVNLPKETSTDVKAGVAPLVAQRRGESFIITPQWVGSESTGLVPPDIYTEGGRPLTLATAMAISGAAVNTHDMGKLPAFLSTVMTLFNIRLGYWLPNPRYLNYTGDDGKERSGAFSDVPPGWKGFLHRVLLQNPVWPQYFLKEAFSSFHSRSYRVLLSDGGHFDNLGLYELVRRKCRYLILCDASADPARRFDDLAETVRRCRVDHHAEVHLDLSVLKPDPDTGRSLRHVVVGEVVYSDGARGNIVYIKSSLTGDEPADVLSYREMHPEFPHESTVDQFFDEAQFESYRKLGQHIGEEVFNLPMSGSIDLFFRDLRDRWRAPASDAGESFVDLCNDFMDLERDEAVQAPNLLDLEQYPELFGNLDEATLEELSTPTAEDQFKMVHHVIRQLQFMENFWVALKLDDPKNVQHPDNRGALNLFRRWARSPYFRSVYPAVRSIYGKVFQLFCETELHLDANGACLDVRRLEKLDDEGVERCKAILKFDPLLGSLEDEFKRLIASKRSIQLYTADLVGTPNPASIGCGVLIVDEKDSQPAFGELFCFLIDNRFYFCGIADSLIAEILEKHAHRHIVMLPLVTKEGNNSRWDLRQWKTAISYFQLFGFLSREVARGAKETSPVEAYVLKIRSLAPREKEKVEDLDPIPYLYLPPRETPEVAVPRPPATEFQAKLDGLAATLEKAGQRLSASPVVRFFGKAK
ncbi:MAG TPA: hypothetical protein VNM14_22540 [Planctomycetota bacterium]|nr:hypothetical protein [Planctomycetota bacterium]